MEGIEAEPPSNEHCQADNTTPSGIARINSAHKRSSYFANPDTAALLPGYTIADVADRGNRLAFERNCA